jgi:hypothetical protein
MFALDPDDALVVVVRLAHPAGVAVNDDALAPTVNVEVKPSCGSKSCTPLAPPLVAGNATLIV